MEKNSESFADLFNEDQKKTVRRLIRGQRITATVAGFSGESIFLDTGAKSEGILNASELADSDGNITVAVGDTLEVYFIQAKAAEQIFTTKIGAGSNNAHIEEAWRSGIPVDGLVKAEIKGGFEITLGGNTRAFCPYSQMGLRRVEDAGSEYLGTRMAFKITRFEEGGRNIVVSARAILEEERERLKESLQQSLREGMAISGTVTSIRDFGAFVDIGGMEGLIPISEIGWSRVEDIKEHFTVGQAVTAIIKSLDWTKGRIALSLKDTLEDPWEKVRKEFLPGTSLQGKVARLTPFGAFITLAPGIDGLIHISKLGGGRRINHPREVMEAGQDVEVTIEAVDNDKRKISLTPADYEAPEVQEEIERKELKEFQASRRRESQQTKEIGSLGELLKAKLAQKGRG
ncbi:MAG: 30S ribosomal protein S1 [Desulfocapsaceae bacterium]|nr:30S ribosomal protein S1 [Desulfocapsaceae bacterium]